VTHAILLRMLETESSSCTFNGWYADLLTSKSRWSV